MPVYIGTRFISGQIGTLHRSRHKGPFWDQFSWYEINGEANGKEIEWLFLNVLTRSLQLLDKKEGGGFPPGRKIRPTSEAPIETRWPKGGAGTKHHRKRTH